MSRKYKLERCTGCGLIFLNPRPKEQTTGDFYREEGYDPFVSISAPKNLYQRVYIFARRQVLIWKQRLIGSILPHDARILDIGCGTGEFLGALSDKYIIEGIEPEPKAAQWASERFGFKVYTGDLGNALPDLGQYDLVTLWHVLEHMPDPVRELDRIYQLLSKNGWLLIALPNIGSLDARIYGSCWVALDAPRHLWHFSKSQLKLLTQRSEFKMIRSGMLPLDTFYNSLQSEIICQKIKGNTQLILAPFRLIAAVLGSLIWGAINGQHSGMYYLFKKI